jgi:hypothetical protein
MIEKILLIIFFLNNSFNIFSTQQSAENDLRKALGRIVMIESKMRSFINSPQAIFFIQQREKVRNEIEALKIILPEGRADEIIETFKIKQMIKSAL